jgi:Tol biopolymer transport system component
MKKDNGYLFILLFFLASCEVSPDARMQTPEQPIATNTKEPNNNTLFSFTPTSSITKNECLSMNQEKIMKGGMVFTLAQMENLNTDIFLFDLEEDYIYQVTNNPEEDYMPAISNDGKEIVFISNREEQSAYGLYLINTEIREKGGIIEEKEKPVRLIMRSDYEIRSPKWSPSNEWIAFTRRIKGRSFIDIINRDTRISKNVYTKDNWNEVSAWSSGDDMLYIVNRSDEDITCGEKIEKIGIDGILENKNPKEYFISGCIHQDGEIDVNKKGEVVFTLKRNNSLDITILFTESGIIRSIPSDNNINWSPKWSPDGEWLAYLSRGDEETRYVIYNIDREKNYVIHSDANEIFRRTMIWAPDGKYIAYTKFISDFEYNIEIVNVEAILESEQCPIIPIIKKHITGPMLELAEWIN